MTEGGTPGFMLILIAGFLQGTFMLPMKYAQRWGWENTWLGFSISGYLMFPWLVAGITVPDLAEVLASTTRPTVVKTLLWGLGWGVGGLLFGLGVKYVGLALGFAVVIGLTAAIGTLIPLFMLSQMDPTSSQGLLVISGVVVALVGISVCSWAGKLRETTSVRGPTGSDSSPKRSYAVGLTLCILSGILCPCGNLGFAFGSEVTAAAARLGTAAQYAAYPLWALLTLPPFMCSGAYCIYLLVRNQTFACYLLKGTGRNYLLATSMGAMWLGGMLLYGMGANQLGSLGSSIGWAIVMSLMVIVANLWGLLTGEWRGVGRRPLRIMGTGLAILVVAMFMVGAGVG